MRNKNNQDAQLRRSRKRKGLSVMPTSWDPLRPQKRAALAFCLWARDVQIYQELKNAQDEALKAQPVNISETEQ